ncbi:lasso peptide biosynthesis B2 protein [Cereibacter sediminicola]|uniref:lasso peptide biosynthesis B2 protein n=1 Tax=Cereibacter sediminicola TaxID=2584941 RepID=UPI0011A5EB81|nr:lasso peptide biosynthesis B2 protein [Cereibacter sediminicola]
MRRVRRLLTLRPAEALALWRALAEVARVRLAIARRRTDAVRTATAAFGAAGVAPAAEQRVVAWSVTAAARLVPGATCLTQALAGQRLLARKGYASTVRISLPNGRDSDFRPHAWLLSDNVIVLGGSSMDYSQHRALVDYESSGRTDPVAEPATGAAL